MPQKEPQFRYEIKIGDKQEINVSSLREAAKQSSIPEDTLEYYFVRKKATTVERGNVTIVKKVRKIKTIVSYE